MSTHRKADADAPDGYFAWEAAGLEWLRDAGGAPVVEVVEIGAHHLDLARLTEVAPTRAAAHSFGAALARTHDAGAPAHGAPPAGWRGDGFFGPLHQPLPLVLGEWSDWAVFWAEARLRPMVRRCRDAGVYDATQAATLDALAERVAEGEDGTPDEPPSRVHGDLWSGNVMWTGDGAVLIDPAAHGGHRETDLALLALFGAPHLDAILAGYQEQHPLADGWRGRQRLHQLHCVLVHAEVFGGGYAARALAAAR